MTKSISNSTFYTSSDYHNALRAIDKIKKAVSLVEDGNNVVDFPRYVQAYTELVQQLIATDDSSSTNSKMEVAHRKLSNELYGLEKRIVAASVRMNITPPSKELMQILKINVPPSEAKPVQKWTWTQMAKYAKYSVYATAAGLTGYAVYRSYDTIRQLPGMIKEIFEDESIQQFQETFKKEIFEDESIQQFQETFKKTVLENEMIKQIPQKLPGVMKKLAKQTVTTGSTAMTVLDNTVKGGQLYLNGLGSGINLARTSLSSVTGLDIPPGDPTEEGFRFIVNLATARFLLSAAKPYYTPFLGPFAPILLLPIDLIVDGAVVCNAIHPNCTSLIVENGKATVHTLQENPAETFGAGAVAVQTWGIIGQDIVDYISSAKGSKLTATSYFLIARESAKLAIDAACPDLIANKSKEYPLTAEFSNWGGTLGSVAGPWVASWSGIAKTWGDAAKNAIPALVPGQPGVTDAGIEAVNKLRDAAFAKNYQKTFAVASFVSGTAGTVLPIVGTAVKTSWDDGILGQHSYITTTAATTGLTAAAGVGYFLYPVVAGAALPITTLGALSLGVGAVAATTVIVAGTTLNAIGSILSNSLSGEPSLENPDSDLLSLGVSKEITQPQLKNGVPANPNQRKPGKNLMNPGNR